MAMRSIGCGAMVLSVEFNAVTPAELILPATSVRDGRVASTVAPSGVVARDSHRPLLRGRLCAVVVPLLRRRACTRGRHEKQRSTSDNHAQGARRSHSDSNALVGPASPSSYQRMMRSASGSSKWDTP